MSQEISRELKYKLQKKGRNWLALKLVGNKWLPLMPDYSLASSAIGALESEMGRDVWREDKNADAPIA